MIWQPGESSRPPSVPVGIGRPWPSWAKLALSAALLYHMGGILAASLAVYPCSPVEVRALTYFRRYFEFTNQGYGYRYYSRLNVTDDPHNPRPWGTPVVTAEIEFVKAGGGKSTERVRLPGRERPWPRLRYQREIDLAFHLTSDPRWAASYARHLCKTRGCDRVTLYTQEHRIPDLALVRQAAAGDGVPAIDLEDESTYSPLVKLGEFRCADF